MLMELYRLSYLLINIKIILLYFNNIIVFTTSCNINLIYHCNL